MYLQQYFTLVSGLKSQTGLKFAMYIVMDTLRMVPPNEDVFLQTGYNFGGKVDLNKG